jgi:hypothetical protein
MNPLSSARFPVLALAFLGLAACSSAPPPHPTYPDIHFTSEPALQLDVAGIEVRNDYRPPFRAPNVEHLFPVPPARAAETWAHDRLKAVGHSGRAVFTIEKASVTETDLKTKGGITGAFTTQPAQRYDATLAATLTILDDHGLPVRTASGKVTRSQSVLEGVTPNQRDQSWYDMTKAMMADFDQQMTAEVQKNFGYYLK